MQTSFCPAAGNGIIYQPEYDSESLYDTGAEGLIYPVKGKGNFVAETRQIQEKSKEDFRKEFLELVRRGINTGMTEEELMTLVQKGYEEEQR